LDSPSHTEQECVKLPGRTFAKSCPGFLDP